MTLKTLLIMLNSKLCHQRNKLILELSTLTHPINLKCLTHSYFVKQMNRLIRFDPSFLPSSQHRRNLSLGVFVTIPGLKHMP